MPPTNPYIGARPFRRSEKIYGRAREARDLLSLLVGDRIVLLNSPSGAGKTSLIQAALIPRLEQRRFAVRPTIRVGAASPVPGANRYLLSVMQSLEDARPATEQLPPAELAQLSLKDYLAQRASQGAENGQVLIFDQFEEVLTLDPTDEAARQAFFEQLGDALTDPWVWALFAIREEYVAALEPYLNLVPTRFANTFRLELLGVEAAAEAIRGPAASREVGFAEGVAEAMALNLANITVQDAEGRPVERAGTSVEPVQLQVVCYRLWEQRFAEAEVSGQTISAEDVQRIGSIDNALREYYESGVAKASAAGEVSERIVRSWFDVQLITRQGFRNQVLAGGEKSFGLNDATIDGLTNAYLVREERRRGVTWLELTHDRLIGPVRASNAHWFAAYLSPLQRQAEIWAAQGQPDSLLFRDAELAESEVWVAANMAALTADEKLFLEQCREERRRAEERARQARRIRNLAVGASIAAVLAVIAAFTALGFYGQANDNYVKAVAARATSDANYTRAEENRQTAVANEQLAQTQQAIAESNARVSVARELAAASVNRIEANPELAVLLGIQAVRATLPGDPGVSEATDSLQQAAQAARLAQTIALPEATVYQVAYSADGRYAAAANGPGAVSVWESGPPLTPYRTLRPVGDIYALAFDPQGGTLATGGSDMRLQLWDLNGDGPPRESDAYSGLITRIVYSPDGQLIALGGTSSAAIVLDSATLTPRFELPHGNFIPDVAFSADGGQIATASWDRSVKVWDAQTGELLRTLPHPDIASAAAFSPDGGLLVTGGYGTDLFVWDLTAPPPADGAAPEPARLGGHTNSIFSVAFSPDGEWMASTGADAQVRLWNMTTRRTVAVLSGHQGPITSLAFRPDSHALITSSQDGTVRAWRLGMLQPDPIYGLALAPGGRLVAGDAGGDTYVWDAANDARGSRLSGQGGQIYRVAASPSGDLFATASDNGSIWLWDAASGRRTGIPIIRPQPLVDVAFRDVAFSSDGTQIFGVGDDAAVQRWNVTSRAELAPVGAHDPAVQVKALAVSPDGRMLATGDTAGVVHVWDLGAGGDLLPPLAYPGEVSHLSFSPDSRRLAVGGVSPTPQIYDLATPDSPLLLEGHGARADQAVFSPDGALLSSISEDETARIWDAASGALLRIISLPSAATPYGAAFTGDGKALAVAGSDGVVRLIPMQTDDLLALALRRVSRESLSDEECRAYLHQSAGCAAAP